jgi:hypothetical protein
MRIGWSLGSILKNPNRYILLLKIFEPK